MCTFLFFSKYSKLLSSRIPTPSTLWRYKNLIVFCEGISDRSSSIWSHWGFCTNCIIGSSNWLGTTSNSNSKEHKRSREPGMECNRWFRDIPHYCHNISIFIHHHYHLVIVNITAFIAIIKSSVTFIFIITSILTCIIIIVIPITTIIATTIIINNVPSSSPTS